jgi:hypothetical protein
MWNLFERTILAHKMGNSQYNRRYQSQTRIDPGSLVSETSWKSHFKEGEKN